MSVKVGRRDTKRGVKGDPSIKTYRKVICMTPSTPYGDISPYSLKNEKGEIIENVWQFSKFFNKVYKVRQTYSRWDQRVIWEHPEEEHVIEGMPNNKYTEWRNKGFANEYAIRYSNGFKHRHECVCAYSQDDTEYERPLDYITARKEMYLPLYINAVQDQPKFLKLKNLLKKGQNLLIIEPDGPHEESMDYYKDKYGVSDDFIVDNTVEVNEENMRILLNDPKHNFGHGFCLGLALLGIDLV